MSERYEGEAEDIRRQDELDREIREQKDQAQHELRDTLHHMRNNHERVVNDLVIAQRHAHPEIASRMVEEIRWGEIQEYLENNILLPSETNSLIGGFAAPHAIEESKEMEELHYQQNRMRVILDRKKQLEDIIHSLD